MTRCRPCHRSETKSELHVGKYVRNGIFTVSWDQSPQINLSRDRREQKEFKIQALSSEEPRSPRYIIDFQTKVCRVALSSLSSSHFLPAHHTPHHTTLHTTPALFYSRAISMLSALRGSSLHLLPPSRGSECMNIKSSLKLLKICLKYYLQCMIQIYLFMQGWLGRAMSMVEW